MKDLSYIKMVIQNNFNDGTVNWYIIINYTNKLYNKHKKQKKSLKKDSKKIKQKKLSNTKIKS